MDITKVSIIHHVGIVLALLWFLSSFGYNHPVLYFLSLLYLYQVHESYVVRLQKKLKYEERKQANQKRMLSDSETVRWLNGTVEKIWPICMEQIASQKILLPIIPWFLEKYKPWTAKEAVVESLYMGRNPPMFTEIRVVSQSSGDDHLVLELGMNFLSADDMSAIIAVKLRKRLGFGMWTKLHMTGMHVEGKVLVGVKFLREWPFLGRVRICFTEPPYFQMTVKPLFNHGLDVTEIPGIAGWIDELLGIAFEQTLVEPNMLVVDMEKFVSSSTENWFSVDEKSPVAFAELEIIEAAEIKPADLNGFSDPYVIGQIGSYKFQTKVQKKTLTPKWLEEFKIPIVTWESPNMLTIEVRDKDHFGYDALGTCSININDIKGAEHRHDMWLPLQNIKMGRLHLAVTVVHVEGKVRKSSTRDKQQSSKKESTATPSTSTATPSTSGENAKKGSVSTVTSGNVGQMADEFEPINIEGQEQTGIWVHHPGSDVSQTWKPRKGKSRHSDIQIHNEDSSSNSRGSHSDSNSDESREGHKHKPFGAIRRSLRKLGSVFHRSPREDVSPPSDNAHAVNEKGTVAQFKMDNDISEAMESSKSEKESLNPEMNEVMSPRQSLNPERTEVMSPRQSLNPEMNEVMSPRQSLNPERTEVMSPRQSLNPEMNEVMSPRQSLNPERTEVMSPRQSLNPERTEVMSPRQSEKKGIGKSILKGAERSVHNLKHAVSRKESKKSKMGSVSESTVEKDSNDDLPSSTDSTPRVDVPKFSTPTEQNIHVAPYNSDIRMEEPAVKEVICQGVGRTDDDSVTSPDICGERQVVESLNVKVAEGNP